MNNAIINNIPSANRKNFGYKSINTSHAHNENQEEVLNDILDLFNKTNAIERVVNQNMEFIQYENRTLETINNLVLDKMEKLVSDYEEIKGDKIDRKITITPADCTIFDDNYGAVINRSTASITNKPSKKISKFAIFDDVTDSMYLPDTLDVNILNTSDKGIISQADNDIYAPFYKDNNLYWTRRVVTDNSVESISVEYIITLPEDIATTPEMNELVIHPFMSKVVHVYCRYGDSSSWESIPGQEFNISINNRDTDKLNAAIRSYRPIRLNFANKKINQLKILLTSDIYKENETNLRTFMFGIKEIAGFINYYANYESSSFQFDTTIPPIGDYLITGIKVYFNNNNDYGVYSKDFNYEFYYKDSGNEYHKITDNFPFKPITDDIRVRCKFGTRYHEMNIKKIEVLYKKTV